MTQGQPCQHIWICEAPSFVGRDAKGETVTRATPRQCRLCGQQGEDREIEKYSKAGDSWRNNFVLPNSPRERDRAKRGASTAQKEDTRVMAELTEQAYQAAQEIAAYLLAGRDKRSLHRGQRRDMLDHEAEVTAMLALVGRGQAAQLLGVVANSISNRYGQRSPNGHHRRRIHDADTMTRALSQMPQLRESWQTKAAMQEWAKQPETKAAIKQGVRDYQEGQTQPWGGVREEYPIPLPSEEKMSAGPLPLIVTAADVLALSESGRALFWAVYGELWLIRNQGGSK